MATTANPSSASPCGGIETLPGAEVQADSLRQELAKFRRDLDDVPHDYLSMSSAQRHAAYERLSQAAEEAARIAETAVRSLDELAKATQRDPLTDTPNRTLLLDRLENAVMMARRRAARLAVMYLDLDHFKRVNDTLGHACGDEVLKLVARRLEEVVRDSDTVSRFGGDEFVVLLPEISKPGDAGLIAAKMLEALAQPSDLPTPEATVRASIGISLFPDDGDQVAALLESADTAMYRAKKVPGSAYRFHSAPAAEADPGQARADNLAISAGNTQSLRQANERLVLSVLAGQPVDAETEAMHGRRVRFLAMVAHELRHPLAPIRTAADLIRRANGDEAVLERMHAVIENQVTHMARLVDDLLDDARLDRGRFRMQQVPVDVSEVLRQVAETWQPAFALKHQAFRLRFPASGLWVRGDADRLAQVLVNLLDNASKYTPDGGHVSLAGRSQGGRIVVTVSDNGMGLTDDMHECIFDLFARGTQAMAVHKGGLGIGLAVARELVEAHAGVLSASSDGRDRGSAFEVSLPAITAAPDA
ncbi:diguanylate cyclase domain-containing protein [Arenimonas sp. MALMAid1274]|uniref:diguanylate cyclase domain-containing protein n=1 Tax=Arenimonas sp. MALMAid1274 TaxID=3411630 RepID=UPI003B9F5666